ncbi:MAG TPA: DUF4880 domain-containing protein, partial [Gemmatimonadaceae bacterium]
MDPKPPVDELILAALQDRVTPDEAAQLEAWRRASPHNEAHYQTMERLWRTSARTDPLESRVSAAPSLHELRSRRSRRQFAGRGITALRRMGWPRWIAAAAAAAVLLFAV